MEKLRTIHTSRTIMFYEFGKIMDYAIDNYNFEEALNSNVYNKKSADGIRKSANFLKRLYDFDLQHPPFKALCWFWKNSENHDKPLLAFIYAIGNDQLLGEGFNVIGDTPVGQKASIDFFEDNIESFHPKKYSDNTRKSLAQNIASSWKQAGFITGKVKNIRTQPEISYYAACFAFLLSYLKGNTGDFIWNSTGVKALCLNEAKLRELAVEAAKRDLIQYQYAGSVTVISFSNLLNKIGINAI
jgi:hypothetical protein